MVLARTRFWTELFELIKNEPLKAILLLGVLALCLFLLHEWIGLSTRQRRGRGIMIRDRRWPLLVPLSMLLRDRLSDEELWNSDGTYRQDVNQDASAPDDADRVWRNHHKLRMKRSRPSRKKRRVQPNPLK
ncbi:MAG TPA: hypothetical protein VGE45_18090 [Chloroflexia bacterium]|jgi:hypothetical protein